MAEDLCSTRAGIAAASLDRLELLDARGHRVRTLRCAPGQRELQLDREGLANGLYVVVARGADGEVAAVGRVIFE